MRGTAEEPEEAFPSQTGGPELPGGGVNLALQFSAPFFASLESGRPVIISADCFEANPPFLDY